MSGLSLIFTFLLQVLVPTPTPYGVVAGRVYISGKAAAGVFVAALAVPDPNTAGRAAIIASSQTDSAGVFRIDRLSPGRYYIVTGDPDRPVYYPGGLASADRATIITMVPGLTVDGLVFAISPVTVSGRVLDLENSHQSASLTVVFRGIRNGFIGASFTTTTDAAGAFTLSDVPPGRYFAVVRAPSIAGMGAQVTGMNEQVTVGDRDVRGIELTVPAELPPEPVHLLGSVVVEGGGALPNADFKLVFSPIRPSNEAIATASPFLAKLGSHSIGIGKNGVIDTRLQSGVEYRVHAEDVSADYQVQAIMYGSVDLQTTPLTADAANPESIQVTLAGDRTAGVTVSGRIRGSASESRSAWPQLLLVSEKDADWFLKTTANADGTFSFARTPGGTYHLQAVDSLFAPVEIDVGNHDVSGIDVLVPGNILVSGRVLVENGNMPDVFPANFLEFVGERVTFDTARTNPNGAFSVNLPAGNYRIRVKQLPSGYTVKSILAGSVDLQKEPLMLPAGETLPTIQITLELKQKGQPPD